MRNDFPADDFVIACQSDLEAALKAIVRAHRMVFFAGLPGVGKSLFIRELATVAYAMGRTVHFLQWDVVRPSFESQGILDRYPEHEGVTHPLVRMAVGQWVREAVSRWHRAHANSPSILIGEVPLIGNRLIELAQVHADDAELRLVASDTLFVTPVPSVPVRAAIEQARERTFANPAHPRESADAPPGVLQQLWLDTRALAVEIGAAAPLTGGPAPFDPQAYAAVYRHLLRHRNAATVMVNTQLTQNTSVYDLPVKATDILPTDDEVAEILMRLEREHTTAEIEHKVSRWFQSI
jgi:hypothetical protein